MSTTKDFFVTGHGAFKKPFNGLPVNSNSVVLANICEVDDNNNPFPGDATMRIHNIVPLDGGVTWVYAEIIWEGDLRARIRFVTDL